MIIYIVIAIISLLLVLLPGNKNRTTFFCFTGFALILIVIASIRDTSVGTDTQSYYEVFNTSNTDNAKNDRSFSSMQFIWFTYNKLCNRFLNYDIFLFITYAFIVFTTLSVIYKYSKNRFLSVSLYILLGYYSGSFNLMRQYFSVSIIFYSYSFLIKRNYKYFWLAVILATTIHSSAIFASILYFIHRIDFSQKKTLLSLILISTYILGMFHINELHNSIKLFSSYVVFVQNDYMAYINMLQEDSVRNIFTNGLLNIIALSVLFFYKKAGNINDSIFFNAYFFSVILFNLVGGMGSVILRVVYYFQISQIIVFSNILEPIQNKKHRYLFYFAIIVYAWVTFFYMTIKIDEIIPYKIRF